MTCSTSGSLDHWHFCSGFTDIHTTTWSNISHEKTINLPCVPTFCVYYYDYDFDYAYFANTFLQAPSIDKPCCLVAVGLGTRIVLWEVIRRSSGTIETRSESVGSFPIVILVSRPTKPRPHRRLTKTVDHSSLGTKVLAKQEAQGKFLVLVIKLNTCRM